ncbi:MAG: right-handed parallel beta-helix repeat-containing protein [Gammaproteobacteria bacterium]|nr:right-handed parallel beta-helix repeat-containing protein [Gammaproteobacteria bacterium]
MIVKPGQSIESAIRGANDGDIIEVMPGVYSQTMRFWGKAVTLRSQTGPGNTIIDGGGQSGPLVSFFDGESNTSVIEGFTLMNGITTGGGGAITAQNGASPTIRNNIIRNNQALIGGGVYLFTNSSAVIENNVFSDNRTEGDNTGGAAIAASHGGHPVIRNNTFLRNTVYGNPASGGAIFLSNRSGATIEENDFQENSCTFEQVDVATGGAIHVIHDTRGNGGVLIANNRFRSNVANYGGAVGAEEGASMRLIDNEFMDNRAHYYGGAFLSHAVFQVGAYPIDGETFDLVLDGNRFIGNSAVEFGGALMLSIEAKGWIGDNTFTENQAGTAGGAIHIDRAFATLIDNTLQGNSASRYGAGLSIYRNSIVRLEHNSISANRLTGSQSEGGGLYMAESQLKMQRNIIMNHSADSGGAAFIDQAQDTVISENNLLAKNQAVFGSAIFLQSSRLDANFNTIASNTASAADANARSAIFPRASQVRLNNTISVNSDRTISRFDPDSTVEIGRILESNPGFVRAGGDLPQDYRLSSSSPAIDQAIEPSVAVDLDGRSRPVGSASDLGAYEYSADEVTTGSTAIEFYNADKDHYFNTANTGDIAFLEANPQSGWFKTGYSFKVYPLDAAPSGTFAVARYYGAQQPDGVYKPDSHFYTALDSERQLLDNGYKAVCPSGQGSCQGEAWFYEKDEYRVYLPDGETCPSGSRPVYRFYNNGFPTKDSNHRYTTDAGVAAEMRVKGWTDEGTKMCAPN